MSYKGKFIETSAGLKHNVDELLVGILKQILLRYEETQPPTALVRVSTVSENNIGNHIIISAQSSCSQLKS
jgi:hypothetical protein